ncbi:MAG: 3-isopropylmalate dehydratase small subunit [Proteobacteria bacterium]|nr:3-isopropylmalate dehydratase small subunit [Pseudomonadota bacterium]
MTPITVLAGPAAVVDRANVDTDQIIPARFLRKPRSAGYNNFLFHDLRTTDPDFPLGPSGNPPILLAGANFGCGSSREGAVYALADAGVHCVIAPGFGDIFVGNASKNGLLTVALPDEDVAALMAAARSGLPLNVDLPAQEVRAGNRSYRFEIDPFRKRRLAEGLDDIGLTLAHEAEIAAYEATHLAACPWAG